MRILSSVVSLSAIDSPFESREKERVRGRGGRRISGVSVGEKSFEVVVEEAETETVP